MKTMKGDRIYLETDLLPFGAKTYYDTHRHHERHR